MRAAYRIALLLACCIWVVCGQAQSNLSKAANSNETIPVQAANVAQDPRQKSGIWDEPIHFSSKAKDSCTMVFSGQGDSTKLRVSCKNKGKSYWCDYQGKPNLCRHYKNNPRHYFTQIMWEMRKLQNACQGPQSYRAHMCRLAVDDASMVLHKSWPKLPKSSATSKTPTTPKALPKKPAKPAAKPGPKPVQPRRPTKSTTPRPTTETESPATKLAEEYCWSSFQGVCAYFISWFQY